MLAKFAFVAVLAFLASAEVSRKGAKTQVEPSFAPLRLCVKLAPVQTSAFSFEVFQVLDLPLTVHEASFVKSDRAYLLKLEVGNSSEEKLVGLRYSLVT